MNETAFCLTCNEKKEFNVKMQRDHATVRGISFSYVESIAFCKDCGNEVYVPEINDKNVVAQEEAYRKAAKLISVQEIKQILEQYQIGAGPLAKIMGFGDVTINRYINGQLPSKNHSDQLLLVLRSYKEMAKHLENSKGEITPIAYSKCRKALDRYDQLNGQNHIELIARYMLKKAADITPLALQKLLYYAHAFYYAIYKEPLFMDECQAWVYGPVFPSIYYLYKDYGYNPIDKVLPEEWDNVPGLSERELEFLDAVVDIFGNYSGKTLSSFTHQETPWIEARGSLLPSDHSVTVIDRVTINDYFGDVVDKLEIKAPCDMEKYCTEMEKQLRKRNNG